MRPKLTTIFLLISAVILITSVSGCIDIHWAKSLLGEEPPPPKYHIDQKWVLDYTFELGPHEDDMPVHILKGTKWMKINVTIVMEQGLGFGRYVKLVVTQPNNEEILSKMYNSTSVDHRTIDNPMEGAWQIYIEGRGISLGDFQDSYHVEVSTYELDRRS
jgi:hypothetical protein